MHFVLVLGEEALYVLKHYGSFGVVHKDAKGIHCTSCKYGKYSYLHVVKMVIENVCKLLYFLHISFIKSKCLHHLKFVHVAQCNRSSYRGNLVSQCNIPFNLPNSLQEKFVTK